MGMKVKWKLSIGHPENMKTGVIEIDDSILEETTEHSLSIYIEEKVREEVEKHIVISHEIIK